MNATAAAAGNTSSSVMADAVSTLTGFHFALIALLALLVIVGVIYGARLKHRRRLAEQIVETHAAKAGVAPVEPSAHHPAASIPTAPSPPPLSDAETVATAAAPLADSPIAAAASPFEATPQIEAASPPSPPPSPSAGDAPVTRLKGLGPKVAARLAELGITQVGQLAALDDDAAARLDSELGTFRGRMARDRWIEQARFLAAGDRAGFEAVFGRL